MFLTTFVLNWLSSFIFELAIPYRSRQVMSVVAISPVFSPDSFTNVNCELAHVNTSIPLAKLWMMKKSTLNNAKG